MSSRVRSIGVTPGCPAGIGPEVAARALLEARIPQATRLVFYASAPQLLEGARRARVNARLSGEAVVLGRGKGARLVHCAVAADDDPGAASRPGRVDARALASQRLALVRACEAARDGALHAIVTGPVRKKALVVNGEAFPGQTEIVHRYVGDDGSAPLMVFGGASFLLGLATVHVALHEVQSALTPAVLDNALARLASAAKHLLARRRPRLVVLGVNPHAGEGGMFGMEEIDVVAPAIARARARGMRVEGPVPADGFFADLARGKAPPDAVLAMHHDQGLAPYKLLVAGEGINITWGLRVPRTSPDHGTADALAGTGTASAASMQVALELAARLATKARFLASRQVRAPRIIG